MKKGIGMTRKAAVVMAALALILSSACIVAEQEDKIIREVEPPKEVSKLVSANTNYAVGSASLVAMDDMSGFPVKDDLLNLGSDPGGVGVTSVFGAERVTMVERSADEVLFLNPANNLAVIDSYTVGAGFWDGNPQDVLVYSKEKAYVSRWGDDDVLVLNPTTGAKPASITFAGIPDNADGLARPAAMMMAGNSVLVALQDMDVSFGFGSTAIGTGKLAVINPADDTVSTSVDLGFYNPIDLEYSERNELVLVACAGRFGDSFWMAHPEESAVLAVQPHPPYGVTTIITGDSVGGNIYKVEEDGRGNAYILVANGFMNEDRMLKLDLSTGTVDPDFRFPDVSNFNEDLSDLAVTPEGYLAVGDRIGRRIVVFDILGDVAIGYVPLTVAPMEFAVLE